MRLVYSVSIATILGIGASLLLNFYTNYRYGIHEDISLLTITQIYGDLLDEVISLYEISDSNQLELKKRELLNEMPTDLGILQLSQRDRGEAGTSYGNTYLGYYPVNYSHAYFYRNSSFRDLPGMIRGYIETDNGSKIDTLKLTKVAPSEDEYLDIELYIDYRKLRELAGEL